MNVKIAIGAGVALLVLSAYLFVSTILNKLEDTIKISAQLEQSLVATTTSLEHQKKVTDDIINITKDIDSKTSKLSDETRKNTYLINKGLKQNEKIDVDASLHNDTINAMCLQWKAVSNAAQPNNKSISIPPNATNSGSITVECGQWRSVTTRESYEYTIKLLEHIGVLNNRLSGLDKYGHSLVDN